MSDSKNMSLKLNLFEVVQEEETLFKETAKFFSPILAK